MLLAKDICFTHKTSKGQQAPPLLSGFDLALSTGEIVAIMAPSGAGKTTLAHIIAGYLKPDSGVCHLGDVLISKPTRDIHLMNQSDSLLPWLSVLGNVLFADILNQSQQESLISRFGRMLISAFFPSRSAERLSSKALSTNTQAIRCLEEVGLLNSAHLFPMQLSGGMRKRAELARALSTKVKLIVLDEPFSGIDALTRFRCLKLLLKLRSEHAFTSILITHDIADAMAVADRVLVGRGRPLKIIKEFKTRFRRGDSALPGVEDEIRQLLLDESEPTRI